MISIYALKHPANGLYFYVGQSVNPRFWLKGRQPHSRKLRFWFSRLRKEKPILEILCKIKGKPNSYLAQFLEGCWIAKLRLVGEPLANGITLTSANEDGDRFIRHQQAKAIEQSKEYDIKYATFKAKP